MTLLLNHDEVCSSVTMADAVEAMEEAFREQGKGAVTQPPRLNVKAGKGWLRIGPAIMEHSGWMGFKAMNLAAGHGLRYQVNLYRVADGELVSIMDAQHLTTLRTGATSAVATRKLANLEPTTVGVLGSGVEARAQAEAMHALGVLKSMRVYSVTPANRERFAENFRQAWKIDAVAVSDPRDAVDGCGIVIAAVKSSETVLLGEWLKPGMHVNSVGTARPEQREIDPNTFLRSAVVVVDTREGVLKEAGDAIAAKDVLSSRKVYELAEVVAGHAPARADTQQITLFKSIGTALQDVALAARIYQHAKELGLGTEVPGFPIMKKL